ncbi:MAG: gliding motility-associated C-terminal domain-containing protein [Saprospiraceae bacterium]|nr:gliding motility-associated C-terminal domain-containing protein [Saprospiraceae bacterium]
MKPGFTLLLLLGWLTGTLNTGMAQTTYPMANQTVTECDGILTDSELGLLPGVYAHNENLTFTICINQADKITLNFVSFCTEETFDILRIFDGPDTLSTLIGGPYSGALGPFSVTATSGCMTVNFISDPNVVCTGWVAVWDTEVDPPLPPAFLPIGNVPCFSDEIILTLNKPVACDSVNASAFTLFGAKTYPVTNAVPINCVGGKTSTIRITLGSPIDFSGSYTVRFKGFQQDECGYPHPFSIETGFSVNDCPLSVLLSLNPDEFCAGHCTQLTATAAGGDPNTYSYKWSPVAPNAMTIQVCTSVPILYSVTVTDAAGSVPAVASLLITPLPKPYIGMDTTLCQTNPALWIPTTIPGGTWYGAGINPDRRWENRWDAWRLGGALVDMVIYVAPTGCTDTLIINKIPLNQGGHNAACPGSPVFKVSGGSPAGGTWSGAGGITPTGFFDPTTPGVYTVTYTHPNGCSGSKNINVADLVLPPDDTICASEPIFNIPVTPYGGTWSGTGIVNPGNGRFDPREAVLGDNILIYTANGCKDTMNIHVRNIDAAWDILACPDAPPFILPGNWTTGGVWSGAGILDSLTGLYDPSVLGHDVNETVTLTVDGCADTRIVYIRETGIYMSDTLRFCMEADSFELRWESVQNSPWNGSWTGPGTFQNQSHEWRWYFSPWQAGPGLHKYVYTANGCSDSMVMEVYAPPLVQADTICIESPPYYLTSTPASSWWDGPGIINQNTGLFDPKQAGQGIHTITTTSTTGCPGGGYVVVQPPDTASLTGLETVYCHRDTNIQIIVSPPGGQLTINGLPAPPVFNPTMQGEGLHVIRYQIGSGECSDEKIRYVNVGPPVSVTTAFDSDTICFAKGRQISAQGVGGSSLGNYSYVWNQSLGFGQTHLVIPNGTTSYTVTVSDGCSDPASGSLEIVVRPQIDLSFQTGPLVCYGDTTYATVTALPLSAYDYTWQTNPPRKGSTINGLSGTYNVEVVDIKTGCKTDGKVSVPGYPPIRANFAVSPNGECVTILEPNIQILDFSNGAVTGSWTFGDGSPIRPYVEGLDVAHTYRDTGIYTVTLTIKNQGGCTSIHQEEVCVKAVTTLFIPNALTANGDGQNDFFQLVGIGVDDITWQIFDRWGQMVFEGTSMDDRWDGNYNNQPLPQGAYVFKARYKTLYLEGWQESTGTVMLLR